MVLVIDTSSACSALALLRPDLTPEREVLRASGREVDVAREAAALVGDAEIHSIAVARGPGSFTGLRSGASYAVGLALGLGLALRPFGSLELQQARAAQPATGVVDAGRGRVYYLTPDGRRGLAEPGELPRLAPVVGWLRETTASGLAAAGVTLLDDSELSGFGRAAAAVVARSPEIACDSLTLEYMQSGMLRRP